MKFIRTLLRNMINVLHIALDFNQNSGISTYLTILFRQFLQKPDLQLHFITNGGNALGHLESVGVKPVLVPMRTGFSNIFYFAQNLRFIKHYCKRHQIQIIHTHHRYPEFIASLVAKKMTLKTITTAHSLVKGQKSLSYKSEKIIAVSNAVRQAIIQQYHVDASKITTLYNCIEEMPSFSNDDCVRNRNTLGIPKSNRIILYIGRFDVIKGTQYLIQAFKNVQKQMENITLLMVGDDHYTSQHTIELGNGCQQIVLPPQEDRHRYFYLSDVVVLPALRDPFPYVMLEAGLARKPFIGSEVDGIAEFIEDGNNGLLFPVGDIEKLTDCITDLLNNPIKANMLGDNLYKKVKLLPTGEQYCDQLESIYLNLLKS